MIEETTIPTVAEAVGLLAARRMSATELASACLARIRAVDGEHSFEGSPDAINAWIRVYEEDAMEQAARADERLTAGDAPPLCGVPLGLKDLYAVAGKPLTASCRAIDLLPEEDSAVWQRLAAAGLVLLGHTHTHECAAGGSTDQVGSPWALDRTAGGSSGGSAAALAAGMVPAATGTDTAGSLRIPSAISGTSTIKPTRGAIPLDGVVPLSWSLDHAGPMARTLEDCVYLLDAMLTAPEGPHRRVDVPTPGRLDGMRLARSPRIDGAGVDDDVMAGYEDAVACCERLGATVVSPELPAAAADAGNDFLDVLTADMLAYHRTIGAPRERYRQSTQDLLGYAEERAMTPEEFDRAQLRRADTTASWRQWLSDHRVHAILEPTVPMVAPVRGKGYDTFFTDEAVAYIVLTHLWDWTGFPVAAIPSGLGPRSGLPVGVSLVGAPGTERRLLEIGIAMQAELGVPRPPARAG